MLEGKAPALELASPEAKSQPSALAASPLSEPPFLQTRRLWGRLARHGVKWKASWRRG